jgi:hypothetical protein
MKSDDESYIHAGKGATTFVGPDATQLFACTVVASAMRLYLKTGIKANRSYTPTNMLAKASSITGKTYKRNQLALAADDLDKWCATMKAALPVVVEP